jgi:erythromycin esterase-like protein
LVPAAELISAIRAAAVELDAERADAGWLLELAGDASVVLIGEASHGTHEYYRIRAELTRALVEHAGFTAVVAEADWPDAYRVNRFVQGLDGGADAADALSVFVRFPAWMWRNTVVRDFAAWLAGHNAGCAPGRRVGFYGMDLYSLYGSIEAVIAHLDGVDPAAARRARARYACLEQFGPDESGYARAAAHGEADPCEEGAVAQLVELRRRAVADGGAAGAVEDEFSAEQNARLIANAERYYRCMYRGREPSWNLRDRHMAETLEALLEHLRRRHGRARAVVWAHNSHLGDARATDMAGRGELNVGQLVRERWGEESFAVGFTGHGGTVTAADDWGEPGRLMHVRPALEGSWEDVMHAAGLPCFALALGGRAPHPALHESRLERAIGVIYRPQTERASHYFGCRLADQFDALVHVDGGRALEPLEPGDLWRAGAEPAETAPSDL